MHTLLDKRTFATLFDNGHIFYPKNSYKSHILDCRVDAQFFLAEVGASS